MPDEPYADYLLTYFTGEDHAGGEQVRFAVSRDGDPLRWDTLAGGDAVLTSELGTGGVRDPFLVRRPSGDGFYLVATDLHIHRSQDWMACQRTGSRSLVVWESPDLVTWSEPWLAEVAPPTAGNVWAPEVTWHEETSSYAVYWASMLYPADDPEHQGVSYNRMLVARTTDFREFTPAQVWVDPGHSVIDSTVIEHEGTFYRFSKDEREAPTPGLDGKSVLLERSDDLLSTDWEYVTGAIGMSTDPELGIRQGEGPTVTKALDRERWYLFIDEYGMRGYIPFETDDLDTGTWTKSRGAELPVDPRHGSIVPITATERARLVEAYGV
jgi:hypothetical protein